MMPSTQPENSGCRPSSFEPRLYINMYAVSLQKITALNILDRNAQNKVMLLRNTTGKEKKEHIKEISVQ